MSAALFGLLQVIVFRPWFPGPTRALLVNDSMYVGSIRYALTVVVKPGFLEYVIAVVYVALNFIKTLY